MKPNEIAARINLLIEIKEISVKKLALRSGLKVPTIYEWTRGDSIPRGDSLLKLADGLDVTIDFLAGRVPYHGIAARGIAVKESLIVYLRQQGIDAGHPDYAIYHKLADPQSAPINFEGWKDLGERIITTIREHMANEKRVTRTARKTAIGKKTKPVLVPIRPLSEGLKRKS
jgi:transcriptional regulator with XRE-family HTH domain